MKVEEVAVPLVEERAIVGKRVIETGRVQVRTRTEQREELVEAELAREEVEVERVPIGREIDVVPAVRQEGDVTIVPVVEEVLVVQKRLVLVEEVHLRRTRRSETVSHPVTLATQRAEVVRDEMGGDPSNQPQS